MKTEWLKGLTGQDKQDLKEYIINNKKMLDIQVKMLYNILRGCESSLEDYDSPSWAYRQAHLNGKKEVIRSLIELFTVDDKS